MPFINVVNYCPNFRARTMTIGSAAARVNGCMNRSMGDGKLLPENSREMNGRVSAMEIDVTASSDMPDISM